MHDLYQRKTGNDILLWLIPMQAGSAPKGGRILEHCEWEHRTENKQTSDVLLFFLLYL